MKMPTLKTVAAALKNFSLPSFVVNRVGVNWGGLARSGVTVSEETAFRSITYWACVRLLSETLASLPLFLYRRQDPRGKEKAAKHPLFQLLHTQPNPEMTSFQLREALMSHVVTWGNAYALKEYDSEMVKIKAIWPLRPDRITVGRDRETREIVYWYHPEASDPLGRLIDGWLPIPAHRVWHIPGLSYDGLVGYSPLNVAREAVGLALATEEFGARFFGQGTNSGAVVEHPGRLSPDGHTNLKNDLQEKYQGLGKAHQVMLLEEGMKFQRTSIPPNDAQFLETRKFQRSEIAAFFHVPPHMIGDLERATFSNIEEQSLEFVVYTMRPWLVRWEQSIIRSLLNPWEREEYFAEFQVDGLLRGDIESRYRAYAVARNWGWMSANDVLELENRNGIGAQGDIYMAPQNMVPADQFNASLPAPPPKSPK